MSKRFFAPILLTLLTCANAAAADYLLRLETAGLRDLPNGTQEADSRTRETVEILVHAGRAFCSSTKNGASRVLLSGKLEDANDGTQRVQVTYRKISASGETVPGVKGQRLPISDAIEVKTAVMTVEIGKAVEFDSNVSNAKKIRTILSVTHFDPSENPD